MLYRTTQILIAAALLVVVLVARRSLAEAAAASGEALPAYSHASDVNRARDRARLLHELAHGALQVVHRDFFDEDDVSTLPSRSLEDVFIEMDKQFGVEFRWLAVTGKTMNVDHDSQDGFERDAVTAIASGEKEFERVEEGRYRHAGWIRLASQCLKCHLPNRRSTQDRAAALSISIPIAGRQP